MINNFANIPAELKQLAQWVVWRYENKDANDTKPTKRPYSPNAKEYAEVDNPRTWGTYDQAIQAYQSGLFAGIGFIFTDSDPYAVIDLDDPEGCNDTFNKQVEIFNQFNSYTEYSPSGKGLHILIKAALPQGRRRSKVEIYSTGRFMTMTGNVLTNRTTEIVDKHLELNALFDIMTKDRNGNNASFYGGSADQLFDDVHVCEMAYAASNGQKFYDLYTGHWDGYYGSQSEADFALVNIIAFYSKNAQQTTRIFRNSQLGQRDKAKRDDYMQYMVNRAFDRMLPPINIDGLKQQLENAIFRSQPLPEPEFIQAPGTKKDDYPLPPGLMGDIANFIYQQSPRPCAPLALSGAIGLMAGVAGRAYNISGTGLNQYVLALARTGLGKEAVAQGIDKLINAIKPQVPDVGKFIGPGAISSPQALNKYLGKGSLSFVSMVGEFGLYMRQMTADNAPPHLSGLRRMLLDLYNKSGGGRALTKAVWADEDKTIDGIIAPAVSVLGESVPERFYEGLHEGMISEGFLPRFTIIEYTGDKPPFNEGFLQVKPTKELVNNFATLCVNALHLNSTNQPLNILIDSDADATFTKFRDYCDEQERGKTDVIVNLWTRNHMKALKMAGLVAVGCNPYQPTVTLDIANWAIDLVLSDTRNLLGKFHRGEIGADNNEARQLEVVIEAVGDYLKKPFSEIVGYIGESGLQFYQDRVVPYSYIHKRCCRVSAFKNDKAGATNSIKRALNTLTESGDLEFIDAINMKKRYNSSARAYAISKLDSFGLR